MKQAASKKFRPNVIFILSDDQGCWAMGCAGNKEIRTPNIDALARTGIRFENFFCASPVCSPARASILTGRIPSHHGIHDWLAAGDTIARYEPARNGKRIEYLKGQPGYTDLLDSAGYHCGISGKWHLGDTSHPQKGFRFWYVHAKGGGPYYNAPMVKNGKIYEEPRYVTDAITDNAIKFLEARKREAGPFYLSVHYTAPHAPWERVHHPAQVFDLYHKNCPFESVPDGLPVAEWFEYLAMTGNENSETRRTWLSGYYTAVTEMDRNIGRLIKWLETNGLREDTLVVFTSDNGMNMGHHGLYGKGNATFPLNMYEESVKVPFIMSLPGRIPEDTVNSSLLSHYDFMPTLLDYLSIENPQGKLLPGRSFADLLPGKAIRHNDYVVIFDEYGPVRMVRTKDWKYIRRYPYGPDELYNLESDRMEEHNLAGIPEHSKKEREMQNVLREWFSRYADPARDGRHQAVTGLGQTGLCGNGITQSFQKFGVYATTRKSAYLNEPLHKYVDDK